MGKFILFVVVAAFLAAAVHTHQKLYSGPDVTGRFASTIGCERSGGEPELAYYNDKYAGWRCQGAH